MYLKHQEPDGLKVHRWKSPYDFSHKHEKAGAVILILDKVDFFTKTPTELKQGIIFSDKKVNTSVT